MNAGSWPVGYGAFRDCKSLDNITIPASVETIEQKVMVAVGYLVGIPTSFQVPWVVYEVADVSVTTLLHHRFDAVVCQHRLEQCKRFDAVKRSVKAVAPYLRNDFHIGADRK